MPNATKGKKEEMKGGSVSVGSSHSTTLFLAIIVILYGASTTSTAIYTAKEQLLIHLK